MRASTWCSVLTGLLPLLLIGLAPSPAAARENGPETVVVERGPLELTVDVDGVLLATRYQAMRCWPRDPRGSLEVVEAVGAGPVVKGQVLVQFTDQALEDAVAAAEVSLRLAEIKLERRKETAGLARAERAASMDEAVRAKQRADEAFDRFVTVERKLRQTEAIHRLEGAKHRLKDQLEELQQLEKMYGEDDLTEETEEIVLNRARRSYERAIKSFEFQKQRHDWFMTITLPQDQENLQHKARKATNHLERLRSNFSFDLKSEKLELQQAELGLQRQEHALADLLEHRGNLTVRAPFAGVAVPGTLRGGRWSGIREPDDLLVAGEKLGSGTVLYTVVDPTSLELWASVEAEDLPQVKEGQAVRFTTALTGDEAFEAKVSSVARFGTRGKHAVRAALVSKDERLRTGLGAKLEIERHEPPAVLHLPAACIASEKGKHFVWVATEDGAEKTAVKVGRKAGDRREIEDGVEAGQLVLATPPEKK
jgi:HlyD family secretion protein